MNSKTQYHKEKRRILNSNTSDLEKSSMLFNNWIDYVFSAATNAECNSLKYNTEKVRNHEYRR